MGVKFNVQLRASEVKGLSPTHSERRRSVWVGQTGEAAAVQCQTGTQGSSVPLLFNNSVQPWTSPSIPAFQSNYPFLDLCYCPKRCAIFFFFLFPERQTNLVVRRTDFGLRGSEMNSKSLDVKVA